MTLVAHGGNLLVDLPLYAMPILAVILALVISTARSRRARSVASKPARSRKSR